MSREHYKSLFKQLDQFLDIKITKRITCCDDKRNIIISDLLLPTCIECGTINNMPENVEVYEYWKNHNGKPKTRIPYNSSHRNINRLHKWTLNTYAESEICRLFVFIDKLNIPNQVKRMAKIKMKKYYIKDKVVTRNNIRRGLICYCIYWAYIEMKIKVNIDDLFKLLKITCVHYNSAIKKLSEDQLFYPENVDKYLNIIKTKMDKNELIAIYSGICIKNTKTNKKSIILGIIYSKLKNEKTKSTFFIRMNISKTSITKILELLK